METTARGFQKWLALALGVRESQISMIANRKRPITREMARKLIHLLPHTDFDYWLESTISIKTRLWASGQEAYKASLKAEDK